MLLRNPHDLAGLVRDGRSRLGWSQSELAGRVGVSRQWISMVENGKTSVEFDLVVGTLRALGFHLHVGSSIASPFRDPASHDPPPRDPPIPTHDRSGRTPLTRGGEPLGRARSKRRPTPGGRAAPDA